jgi:hypothetical protein
VCSRHGRQSNGACNEEESIYGRSVYLPFLLLEVGFWGAINMGALPKAITAFSQLMSI